MASVENVTKAVCVPSAEIELVVNTAVAPAGTPVNEKFTGLPPSEPVVMESWMAFVAVLPMVIGYGAATPYGTVTRTGIAFIRTDCAQDVAEARKSTNSMPAKPAVNGCRKRRLVMQGRVIFIVVGSVGC